jgi:hypothetical protein
MAGKSTATLLAGCLSAAFHSPILIIPSTANILHSLRIRRNRKVRHLPHGTQPEPFQCILRSSKLPRIHFNTMLHTLHHTANSTTFIPTTLSKTDYYVTIRCSSTKLCISPKDCVPHDNQNNTDYFPTQNTRLGLCIIVTECFL